MRRLIYDSDMWLSMNAEQLQTLEQVSQFVDGSEALEWGIRVQGSNYPREVPLDRGGADKIKISCLKRDENGVIRKYIKRITGNSGAPVSSLIKTYKGTGTKENGIQKAPFSSEVSLIRSWAVGQNRWITQVVKWISHQKDYCQTPSRNGAQSPGLPLLVNPWTTRTGDISPHRFRDAFAAQSKLWNALCLLPIITC